MCTSYTNSVSDEMQAPLPAPWDAMWGRREPSDRGRPATLTLDSLVSAAVAIADSGGIDSVSMGKVANSVGCAPMALYRHVTNKDELIALMVEASVGPLDLPEVGDDWRTSLERWAWALLAVVRKHRWLMSVPLTQLPFGPNRLIWLELGLSALADTEVPEKRKADVIMLLNSYVFSEARMAAELAPTADTGAESTRMLASLIDVARFPAIVRAAAGGMFAAEAGSSDADFGFGLDVLLDGIGRLIGD